jgi:hypothetical protein
MIRRVSPFLIALLGGACSTTVPIAVSTSTIKEDRGVAVTTSYTGTIRTGACSGSFNGPIGAGVATAALSCVGGRSGYGTVTIAEGAVAGGTISFQDGTTARIVRLPPQAAVPTSYGWGILGPAVDLYNWGSQYGQPPS